MVFLNIANHKCIFSTYIQYIYIFNIQTYMCVCDSRAYVLLSAMGMTLLISDIRNGPEKKGKKQSWLGSFRFPYFLLHLVPHIL